jgi:hypothetical protein
MRLPLRSPGSARPAFPWFTASMRCSDSLRTLPPRFVVLRLAVPSRGPVFVAPHRPDADRGPGALGSGSSVGQNLSRWSRRASQVSGQPRCSYTLFFDPGRTGHPLPWQCADAAPVLSKTKAPAGSTLEAQSHGLAAGCLRFAVALTGPRRKIRFRLLARLCRAGLATRTVATKGF